MKSRVALEGYWSPFAAETGIQPHPFPLIARSRRRTPFPDRTTSEVPHEECNKIGWVKSTSVQWLGFALMLAFGEDTRYKACISRITPEKHVSWLKPCPAVGILVNYDDPLI